MDAWDITNQDMRPGDLQILNSKQDSGSGERIRCCLREVGRGENARSSADLSCDIMKLVELHSL